MAIKGYIEVDRERCKGCGLCVEACPKDCLRLSECVNRMGYYYVEQQRPEACTSCTACGVMCPDGCITVYREK